VKLTRQKSILALVAVPLPVGKGLILRLPANIGNK
jgi:hypothetical protein